MTLKLTLEGTEVVTRESFGLSALCWRVACRWLLIFLKILFIYFFRDRGSEGERERNITVWLPLAHLLQKT